MEIVSWLVVGLVSGWWAAQLVKGSGYGLLGDITVGIFGAWLGGYLASEILGIRTPLTGINMMTILVSLLGSVVLIVVLRTIGGRGVD